MKKVKFLKDYSPRKKDEIVEIEKKLADWYISNGLAEEYDCKCEEGKEGCSDCEKHAKSKQVSKEVEEVKPKRTRKKKVSE